MSIPDDPLYLALLNDYKEIYNLFESYNLDENDVIHLCTVLADECRESVDKMKTFRDRKKMSELANTVENYKKQIESLDNRSEKNNDNKDE